ncbi:hypothetical protein F5B22DRAFT_657500 [Xylaria bambusicola]|uniref:uncharacterized protein n=1 Tax=Xylaria bambusicola TaxID=326684 RepID=UPI0020074511|nr:uncharacterized protein F5B22DRAFT_657500 [Xylaria bambusicola]KAI0512863.1 hypothetical protein F5B22DRAFT_657500 [Xylaria bambusicola]
MPAASVPVGYEYDNFRVPADMNSTAMPVQNPLNVNALPYDFAPLDRQDLYQGHRPTFMAPMAHDPMGMMPQPAFPHGDYFQTGYTMQPYPPFRAIPPPPAAQFPVLYGAYNHGAANNKRKLSREVDSPEVENPRKRAKKQKDPKKVGKPNCFMCYRRAMVAQIKNTHPGIENGQISRVASDWWKKLSDAEKQPYIDQAARLRRGEEQLTPIRSPQSAVANPAVNNADREEQLILIRSPQSAVANPAVNNANQEEQLIPIRSPQSAVASPAVDNADREEQLIIIPSPQFAVANPAINNVDREEPLVQSPVSRNDMPDVVQQDEVSTAIAAVSDEDGAELFNNWFNPEVASSPIIQGAEASSVANGNHSNVSDAGPIDHDLPSQFVDNSLNNNEDDPLAFFDFDHVDFSAVLFEQGNDDLDRVLFGP